MIVGRRYAESADGYIMIGCTGIGYMRISISYIQAHMNQKDFRKMINTAHFMIGADSDLYGYYLNIIEAELLDFKKYFCTYQALLARNNAKLMIIQKTREKYGL